MSVLKYECNRRCFALVTLQVLTLAGCSNDPSAVPPLSDSTYALPEAKYTPPSPPTEKAIVANIPAAAAQARLSGPILISDVRRTDHGLGDFFVCMKEANPSPDMPARYYSVFFNSDTFKGQRLSVIMDQCELQTYTPLTQRIPATPQPRAKRIR